MLLLTLTYIHSQTQTKLMPTNSPILPFLVLTMAGGCGVSNLMKQAGEQQLSVCGSGVRGGLVVGVLRHKCPCQSRTRTERVQRRPQQRAKNGCQGRRQRRLSVDRRCHCSVVHWCGETPQAGCDAWVNRAELQVSEVTSRLAFTSQNSTRSVTLPLTRLCTVYLLPLSLYLIG